MLPAAILNFGVKELPVNLSEGWRETTEKFTHIIL